MPRLTQLLQDDDATWRTEDPDDHPGTPLRVVTMRSESVASSQREAWLAKQVEAGCDVLLCHSGLVEVGLDLLAFPTILVYEIIFSTTRWQQAIRRSWRPGQTQEVRVIQLTYEQTMEARGLTLIATKAISSLMVEGKMPSAALNEHAQNSATTNLIMELYEQVVSEVEHGEHGESQNDGIHGTAGIAGHNPVAEALRTTFLALNRVEQETEQYIGAVDLPDEDDAGDREDADDGVFMESAQVVQSAHAPSAQEANTDNNAEWVADPDLTRVTTDTSLAGQQLTMADLWSAPLNALNATTDNTARAETSGDAVSAQSANSAAPGQHRVSWEEMRARLQAEAAARRTTRRRGSSTKPDASATASSGLWTMPSTLASPEGSRESPELFMAPLLPLQAGSDVPGQEPLCTTPSPETFSIDENSLSRAQQPTEDSAASVETSAVEDRSGGHASNEAVDSPDSPIEGNLGQLSLFG